MSEQVSTPIPSFEAAPLLAQLKDFQRRTVDYVFRRLYLDDPPARRFLVADEVGLGKTMVARGVIARAIEHLQARVGRVDVIYICSNATIARQNIARLNVTADEHYAFATRPTMLLHHLAGARSPRRNRINFVSFTPGTMDPTSQTGLKQERALIYRVLEDETQHPDGFRKMLQVGVSNEYWPREIERARLRPIAEDLARRFAGKVRGDAVLLQRLDDLAADFEAAPQDAEATRSAARNEIVGELRKLLAEVCLHELDPDLVILDEFQRFRSLMRKDTEVGELTHWLFEYRDDDGNQARTLLLSATPYLMPRARDEDGVDHYADFLKTIGFLLDDKGEVAALKRDLEAYRHALYAAARGETGALDARRTAVTDRLRAVMVRTERVGSTVALDAMIHEHAPDLELEAREVRSGAALERLARAVGAGNAVEYWQSSPYVLNFMHQDYQLRQRAFDEGSLNEDAVKAARELGSGQLRRSHVRRYAPLEAANARQRYLHRHILDDGQWRLLWLPPALPYAAPGAPFDAVANKTKALIFCAWDVAPNAIAAICSYEAERRMFDAHDEAPSYEEYGQHYRPARFDRDHKTGRPANMTALTLLYPSWALAQAVDPLRLALSLSEAIGAPPSQDVMHAVAAERTAELLAASGVPTHDPGRESDPAWYWAALAYLDAAAPPDFKRWVRSEGGSGWLGHLGRGDESHAGDHVERFKIVGEPGREPLGNPPADLAHVVADVALAAPGVTALRALKRIVPEAELADPELLGAASEIAEGFRSLFNQPEAVAVVRSEHASQPYWRAALAYARAGNLQAVLDEYVHLLVDLLGLQDAGPSRKLADIADAVHKAASLRSARVRASELRISHGRLKDARHQMRARFAMRLSDTHDPDGEGLRLDRIRQAFNSPFRPFVLATTSIGQEGLDFHPYCHGVYHWNLPWNPVDMEQREGRVHRYKGHAIRRNLATAYGLSAVAAGDSEDAGAADPWFAIFERAKRDHAHESDLVPYWIFELDEAAGGVRVERHVPHLPYSKDAQRLKVLRLSLAIYRLAFGQPRQEDLIAYLQEALGVEAAKHLAEAWQITLEPPPERGE